MTLSNNSNTCNSELCQHCQTVRRQTKEVPIKDLMAEFPNIFIVSPNNGGAK